MTRVAGTCPACGRSSLFVGDGGHVTCSMLGCPDPCAAAHRLEGSQPVAWEWIIEAHDPVGNALPQPIAYFTQGAEEHEDELAWQSAEHLSAEHDCPFTVRQRGAAGYRYAFQFGRRIGITNLGLNIVAGSAQ